MTPGSIATRPVRPEECAIAFGLPTDEATFRATSRGSEARSFPRKFAGFGHYEDRFLRPYGRATRSMRRSGVRVVPALSLDVWGELVKSPEVQVVILFSHWEKGAVELHGGFATPGRIVQEVPEASAKIIDLTVCRSVALADELVRERPECVVRLSLTEADELGAKLDPAFWLGFYRALFLSLKRNPRSYIQAVGDAIVGLKRKLSRSAPVPRRGRRCPS